MAENVQNPVASEAQEAPQSYRRFGSGERFEHIILITTFVGLALTGIPQRYAGQDWAQSLIELMGGIESIRIVHRIMATILMAECIYHGGIVTYKLFVLGRKASMLPGIKDVRDVFQFITFNLGLSRQHPHMPRYNFGEKVEYLALVWGTVVMVITGFMLWNPIATTSVLPGSAVPAALAAHSGEALLAVLSIVTWHMYNVHVKRFNRSMFTGHLSREEMEEEHAEELERIEEGHVVENPPAEAILRRNRIFVPYAFIVASILLVGLVWFVTFEDTAITTVDPIPVEPAEELSVSAADGDAELGLIVWEANDCMTCHGENGEGTARSMGTGIANTDLSFEEFVTKVRQGPADMKAYSVRQISDQDLAHLYAYLTSLGGE
ncbi:MAG: c-type cytochrome [Anaerolineae bacterium]|nr:c-type cytochrome [Anaerolineae bacterium]